MHSLYRLCILLVLPIVTNVGLALDLNDYTDPLDRKYIRIQSVFKDKYLSHETGQNTVNYTEVADNRDLRTHWFITATPEPDQYWIRNRVSGQSLHIENQNGLLEIAAFENAFTSHRWVFEPDVDFFRIRSAWQVDQYFTAEDHPDQNLQTAVLDPTFLSQRYRLEAIPHGATLPWTRYDETNLQSLSAPAEIIQQTYTAALDRNSPAAESHNGGCILLNDFGTAATWTATEAADALTLRYSLIDGESGTITLTILPVNGSPSRSQQIPIDSAQAWIYFDGGKEYDTPAAGRVPAKRFADSRILLLDTIQIGDTIQLSRQAGDQLVWVDNLDAEIATTHTPPADAYDVTAAPWNAVGDDTTDDTVAIQNCINAAASAGKSVFIPAGRYNVRAELVLPSGTILEGAGFWQSELFFSETGGARDGGIRADGTDIELRQLYLAGAQVDRDEGYHGIKGLWGGQSTIEHVWIENTETGMWISDLNSPYGFADGLIIRDCRIRNTFADGINLASGTRNTVIENCHIRAAGDDALASWSSGYNRSIGMTQNNRIRYNTVECGWRAGALAVFGGEGHRIHHNLVTDQYIGAGIRGSTLFFFTSGTGGTQVGYPFSDGEPMRIYENTLRRTGARGIFGAELAAIDFQSGFGDVKNIIVEDIIIEQTHFSGMRLHGSFANTSPAPQFSEVSFHNIEISGTPFGTRLSGSAIGAASFEAITLAPASTPEFSNETSGFMVHEVGSLIQFTASGAETFVSEAGAQDSYTVRLLAEPTSNVSVNMLADNQLATAPASLMFTPSNWNSPQTVTVSAIDDALTEGLHFGSIEHSANSADSRFTAAALPDIDARILDNEQNLAPEIDISTPTRTALPLGVGLILEATVSDDGKPVGPLTKSWSVVEKPIGSLVVFDDSSAAETGVRFDLVGKYTLRLTADDSDLNTSGELTVIYGASDGSVLLEGNDIGAVGFGGEQCENNGIQTIRGSGSDVWNQSDEFFFYSAPFQGDGSITIRMLDQSNTFPWAKAGLMIRDSLAPNSSHALLAVTPENGLAFQNRPNSESISFHNDAGAYTFPIWMRLERIGDEVTAYRSTDGLIWQNLGSTTPTMGGGDQIGIFITSHNNGVLGEATFDNLQQDALGLAPMIAPLNPITERIGDTFTLDTAVASDDGLPRPASLSTTWSQQSGAGVLGIDGNQVSSDTAGNYTLRLVADDGAAQSFRDVPVTILSTLEAWKVTNFGSVDTIQAGNEQDPDQDGLSNLEEFAFGGDPIDAGDANTIRPSGSVEPSGASQHFEFDYRRLTNLYSEIHYTLQVSDSLAADSWQTGSASFEVVGAPLDNGDGTETVTIRLIESTADAPKQFIRLKVEQL